MASGMATASYELRFDSGRICLDLLATTHPEERLDSVDRLRAWITRSGLVPAGTPLAAADISWLVGFRELRGHVAQLVRGELDARPADIALARVNAVALAVIARDALELLTDPVARASLRQCEGDTCPIVYLDTSRGRRRRWCSSEVCGNRERVARHRRRAALARA